MNTTKNKNVIFNSVTQGDTLVIEIYDVIGADFFGGGITASMVSTALASGNYKSITVRINSPGGDAFEGIAIYNLLKTSGKQVNVIVDGYACSAASIIAMAGETVTMNTGTQIMIHNAAVLAMGDANELRKTADTLDTVSDGIADIYVGNTTLSKTVILNMMDEETWLGPTEAKEKGFATAISTNARVENSFDFSAFKFKKAPTEVVNAAKTKEVDGEHLTAGDFVYVGNPDDTSTWSLPWHFSTEEKTQSHLRDALARFDQDKVIPKAHRDEVWAKLVRICKQHGIKVDEEADNSNRVDFSLELKRKQLEVNKRK